MNSIILSFCLCVLDFITTNGYYIISDGSIRIVSTDSSCSSGIVQVYKGCSWGNVADCSTSGTYWDDDAAELVCDALGFSSYSSYYRGSDNFGTDLSSTATSSTYYSPSCYYYDDDFCYDCYLSTSSCSSRSDSVVEDSYIGYIDCYGSTTTQTCSYSSTISSWESSNEDNFFECDTYDDCDSDSATDYSTYSWISAIVWILIYIACGYCCYRGGCCGNRRHVQSNPRPMPRAMPDSTLPQKTITSTTPGMTTPGTTGGPVISTVQMQPTTQGIPQQAGQMVMMMNPQTGQMQYYMVANPSQIQQPQQTIIQPQQQMMVTQLQVQQQQQQQFTPQQPVVTQGNIQQPSAPGPYVSPSNGYQPLENNSVNVTGGPGGPGAPGADDEAPPAYANVGRGEGEGGGTGAYH